MSKLLHHRADGTYYTKRYEGRFVTRIIHPDGLAFLKNRGVHIGDQIPPYAISELVSRGWLLSREEAALLDTVNWSPDWESIGVTPAQHRHESWQVAPIDAAPVALSRVPGIATAAPIAYTDFTLPGWGVVAIVATTILVIALGITVFS